MRFNLRRCLLPAMYS
uniref:Uncharacterized protein n=1 Tax=Lepeophtheirus salmonis TaxID=72036 RepID=A0A0K2UU48_LEPSM